jgi:hypothetical protein
VKSIHRIRLAVFAGLMACGGGSGGPPAPPAIQIMSHTDGQVLAYGNRSVTVSGTGARMGSVEVRVNGTALPPSAVTSTVTTFSASVTLGNNANSIEAVATNSGGSASSGVVTVSYPFVTFTTFQSASRVIGQADFSGHAGTTPAENTIAEPVGRALVSGSRLYLPDTFNNRILVYDSIPTTDGASASLVLGQLLFTTLTAGGDAGQLNGPQTVVTESGKLIVADTFNNRVPIWNAIPGQLGAPADVVVGWDRFDLPASGCAQNRLSLPHSVFVVNGKLLVADAFNNRVLIWNSIPTVSGAPADLVLGQTKFTHCASNAGAARPSADTLDQPTDVWSDGTRLVVADLLNDRVLIWNTFPAANGAPADVVLGQTGLTDHVFGASQRMLTAPSFISSNGNQLFVNDQVNSRVLIWNTFPTANNAPADVVLGQSDFTHSTANDDPLAGAPGTPTSRTLAHPTGVALWGSQLIVTDDSNNRYLIFDGQ